MLLVLYNQVTISIFSLTSQAGYTCGNKVESLTLLLAGWTRPYNAQPSWPMRKTLWLCWLLTMATHSALEHTQRGGTLSNMPCLPPLLPHLCKATSPILSSLYIHYTSPLNTTNIFYMNSNSNLGLAFKMLLQSQHHSYSLIYGILYDLLLKTIAMNECALSVFVSPHSVIIPSIDIQCYLCLFICLYDCMAVCMPMAEIKTTCFMKMCIEYTGWVYCLHLSFWRVWLTIIITPRTNYSSLFLLTILNDSFKLCLERVMLL